MEIKRLRSEIDGLLPNDPLIQQKKDQINILLKEKEQIRDRMVDYNNKMSDK